MPGAKRLVTLCHDQKYFNGKLLKNKSIFILRKSVDLKEIWVAKGFFYSG